MTALVRYGFATMLHSQRYLAPLLLFLGTVGVLASDDSGPLLPVYGSCAAALFVCSTWLTIALLSVEHPAHRMITVVAAGRSSRVLVASVLVAVLSCAALAVLGLALPLLFGDHPLRPVDLLVGLAAELTCAGVGIGIGLVCSRLVFRRQGYALILALALVLVMLLVPGLAPVNRLLRLVGTVSDPVALVAPVGGLLAMSVALLIVAAGITQYVTTRRD